MPRESLRAARQSKVADIQESAERIARAYGYRGSSFYDVVKVVGIKSARAHYHFPVEDGLGAAIVACRTARLIDGLGAASDAALQPAKRLPRYVAAVPRALAEDELMC